jgi:flagellar biosynthesis protein FlhG
MAERHGDQAAGLRRLLASQGPRVVAVAAGADRVGRSTTVACLALTLSRLGRRVVVVDGNANAGNLNDLLQANARFELVHALAGERTLGQVLVRSPYGCAVLPAARGLAQLSKPGSWGGVGLLKRLVDLDVGADFVLVDAAARASGLLLPADALGQELLLAVSPEARSITQGYGLIKRLVWRGAPPPCRLLVCQAADGAQAEAIHGNVADVARRHLGMALPLAGWTPADSAVSRAAAHPRSTMAALRDGPFLRAVERLAETLLAPVGEGSSRSHGAMPAMADRRAGRGVTTAAC